MPAKLILPSTPKESTIWKGFAKEKLFGEQGRNNLLRNLVNKRSPKTENRDLRRGRRPAGIPQCQRLSQQIPHRRSMARNWCRIKLMHEIKSAESEKTPAPQGHRPPLRILWLVTSLLSCWSYHHPWNHHLPSCICVKEAILSKIQINYEM